MKKKRTTKHETGRMVLALTLASLLAGCGAGAAAGNDADAGDAADTADLQGIEAGETAETADTDSADKTDADNDAGTFHVTASKGFAASIGDDGENADEENGETAGTKTIMIYMMGSDLEAGGAAATNDMQEMLEHLPDLDQVNVLVYTGGSKNWHNGVPTDANMVYQLIEEGFSPVNEYETVSMGEPDTLTQFLEYGYENYPADSYGLIFWDHGNGPLEGYGKDTLFDNDAMELTELQEALENSPFDEKEKLSFIGFDACLMSSVELACTAAPYSDYLIASQEVEPSYGWNYAFLTDAGEETTEQLIQGIIDSYLEYNEAYFEENENVRSEVTLAAMDLSQTELLEEKINAMFKDAGRDMSGDYISLAYDRVQTRSFGRASTGSEYDLVDLDALMSAMTEEYGDETAEIQELLQEMVVYNGSNTDESCGVSLYYPFYNKSYYKKSWGDAYKELGVLTDYAEYLEKYSTIWLSTDMTDYFEETMEAEGEGNYTYTLQLSEEQAERYASGAYYILRRYNDSGNLYNLVYVSTGVDYDDGKLTADFDGNIIYGVSDYGESFIPLLRQWDTVDGKTRFTTYPTFFESWDKRLSGEDSVSVGGTIQLVVNRETKEVTVTDVVERPSSDDALSSGKLTKIDMDSYAHGYFYMPMRFLTRDEDGRILDFWEWENGSFMSIEDVTLADGLHFTYAPLYDDGAECYIMFRVADVQGNVYCSEPLPLLEEEIAEPEETHSEIMEIAWEDGEYVELWNQNNVTARLYLCEKEKSVPVWILQVQNDNEFKVELDLSDVTVNDSGYDATGFYTTVDADSMIEEELSNLSNLCAAQEVDVPETITFSCDLLTMETDGHMAEPVTIRLTIGEHVEPVVIYEELQNASAEEQVLLETENLRMTLLGFGNELTLPFGSLYGSIKLLVENTADNEQTIELAGAAVNGQYMEETEWGASFVLTLQAGQMGYLRDMAALDLAENLEDDLRSLIYYVEIDDELLTCPVELRTGNEGDEEIIDSLSEDAMAYSGGRKTVYEDDNVTIYEGCMTELEYGRDYCNLWVENKSEDTLTFSPKSLETDEEVLLGDGADDEESNYWILMGTADLPSHTWRQIQIWMGYDFEAQSADLEYVWMKQGTEKILGTSGMLHLDMEDSADSGSEVDE